MSLATLGSAARPFVAFEDRPRRGTNWQLAVHPAGASFNKNTLLVLRAWALHPDWPLLVVTCAGSCLEGETQDILEGHALPNVVHIKSLDEVRFRDTLDAAGLIVLPSACEGFGHSVQQGQARGVRLRCRASPETLLAAQNSEA